MSGPIRLLPGAEPYFQPGGRVGCLLVHGFASSPYEMRWLGQHLAAAGHTVYAPRLPGHGTDPRDLTRPRWRDWVAHLLDASAVLRSQCDQIVLVGHSMGGLLTLQLSLCVPVEGVAVLGSPVRFTNRKTRAARWLKTIQPFSDQTDRSALPGVVRTEQARRGEPASGRVRYDRWATAGVAQLVALADATDAILPQVTAPLLLVYSEADHTAPLFNGQRAFERAGSADKQLKVLHHSGHNVQLDIERETVFALVAEFVARVTHEPDSA